ncbi:MAG: class I SAM-dependent methyltransferase [Spirochaetaceae bacterium]|nr:class I SAM-dependent methyltransferase [Spirochaetaceae bacterium]
MDAHTLLRLAARPALYETAPASIWTDPWIGQRLLAAQLDEGTDAATRRKGQRERALAWIEGKLARSPARVLDLGCGPGLYAEALAARGHALCGIDISAPAVAHARDSAARAGLSIDYRRGDYLKEELGGGWDLVMMIYCDFGALTPEAGESLLEKASRALAPGGLLVFDVFGPGLAEERKPGRGWYRSAGPGFWAERPHLVLEESFAYPEARALASQSLVLVEGEAEPRLYRTWDRWFDREGLEELLRGAGFEPEEIRGDLVEKNDFTSADVLFAAARPNATRGGRG